MIQENLTILIILYQEKIDVIKKCLDQLKQFKIIIDDGSHILSHIIKNLLFFFKYLEKGGYFVVEDFNAPRNYDYLNDSNNQELFFDEILLVAASSPVTGRHQPLLAERLLTIINHFWCSCFAAKTC